MKIVEVNFCCECHETSGVSFLEVLVGKFREDLLKRMRRDGADPIKASEVLETMLAMIEEKDAERREREAVLHEEGEERFGTLVAEYLEEKARRQELRGSGLLRDLDGDDRQAVVDHMLHKGMDPSDATCVMIARGNVLQKEDA